MENETAQPGLVHDFKDISSMKGSKKTVYIIFAVVLFLGLGTGYLFATMKTGGTVTGNSSEQTLAKGEAVEKGQIVGSEDEKTFNDNAEGLLKPGGIEGEGAYHLERPGGPSQNVYLTSSVIDLSLYIDRKVKVWGQTNAAQKAGWLMDVGRLQVLE